ncbi:MAG: HAD-IA family hydrolase [Pirellulaceae bacterium]
MSAIRAFIFDQDGVIVDTERDGHRVAFNQTFAEFGIAAEWGVQEYHDLLQVGGGKERMTHYLRTKGFGVGVGIGMGVDATDLPELVGRLHRRKTDIFIELIETGALPLRPGVHRIMQEASALGLILGVCTTSNERAAQAVAHGMLADIPLQFVLAGDVVPAKKPDPAIYLLALERSGLKPNQCVVFEDSHIGALAAKAAGMHVIATTNLYTAHEDLSMADVVVSCLGEPDGPHAELQSGPRGLALADGCVHARDVVAWFERKGPTA